VGNFRINNSTLTIDDPWGTFEEVPPMGRMGSRFVYGEFETMTLNWDIMSTSDWNELNSRIVAMSGERQVCTIPSYTSSGWRTVYCHLHKPTGSQRKNWVRGVAVQATHISTTGN